MDYYNIVPYRNLAITTFLLGVFSYYGITLLAHLVCVIYPIIKIQAYLTDPKVLNIIETKKKKIPIEDLDLLVESFFWLKYYCVFTLWYVLEYYIYYLPLMNYLKLGVFSWILLSHDIDNNSNVVLYDYIDNLLIRNAITDYYKNLSNYTLDDYKLFFTTNFNNILVTIGLAKLKKLE
jgi:hypothetical protein